MLTRSCCNRRHKEYLDRWVKKNTGIHVIVSNACAANSFWGLIMTYSAHNNTSHSFQPRSCCSWIQIVWREKHFGTFFLIFPFTSIFHLQNHHGGWWRVSSPADIDGPVLFSSVLLCCVSPPASVTYVSLCPHVDVSDSWTGSVAGNEHQCF